MKVGVLGAGAWGCALAKILHDNDHQVTVWGRNAALLDGIKSSGENTRYLPGVPLGKNWNLVSDLTAAVQSQEVLIMAVPSSGFRDVAESLSSFGGCVVSVTKGIEFDSGMTMSDVLAASMPSAQPVALSGPTLAAEVARGMPSAIVAASEQLEHAELVQSLFHRPHFRVYTSSDLVGVELGGALKNVIAIAAGICEGLGFGDNSKAALVTRGIAEMRRLGIKRGAKAETFSGLSGLGDLVVTCFSKLSRNRTFGEKVGAGKSPKTLLNETVSVVEGYPTARSAWQLASKLGVDAPIIGEVYSMLHEGKPVRSAVEDLLSREVKMED